MSLKEKIVKDTIQYTAANYIAMAIGIPVSIGIKWILGTVGSGQWAILKVIGSYGEYSDLGTRNAMIREISQAVGAGAHERSQKIQDNAFSFTFLASLFSFVAIILGSIFFAKDPVLQNGLWILAFLVAATQIYNFSLTLLRTRKKVKSLSVIIVLNIVLVGIFSIAGAFWKGVLGVAVGTFFATAISSYCACRFGNIQLGFEWDWKEIRRLLGIGFPMAIASYALVIFLSVDSVMIAKMIGTHELGLYTIGLMSIQQISALGRFSQIILIPHIQERFGRTGVLGDTTAYFVRTTNSLAHVLPVIIGLIYFIVPAIVHSFLRSFIGGIPAMKILVLGYFFVAVNEMSSTVLFTADKQKNLIPILAVVVLAAAGLNIFFIREGFGIQGVAWATSIAYFLFFLCVFCYAFWKLMSASEVLRMAGGICLTFLYFASTVLCIDRFAHGGSLWSETFLKCTLLLGALFPLLWRLEKKENIIQLLKKMIGFNIT